MCRQVVIQSESMAQVLASLSRPVEIIRWLFLLVLFATPLIWIPLTYELFEFNKMIFVYLMTILIGCVWLWRIISEGKAILPTTPFTIPLLLYFAATLITTFTSMDPHTSIIGYYSRFNGGLLSIAAYTLLYFAFVANAFDKDFVRKACLTIIASSALVSGYAVLERLGIDSSYWMQDVQARVFSTLGQPNWLAALLAMVIPLNIVVFLLANTTKSKVVHFMLFCLNYIAFTFTYSRGGTLGLAAGLAIFGLLSLPYLNRLSKWRITALLAVVFVTVVLFGNALFRTSQFNGIVNRYFPPPAKPSANTQLEVPGTESSKIRLIVWQGAFDIFRSNPIFGSGTETFAYSYYQYRPQAHNYTTEWDFLYNKAHNEFLNELATKGLVGFIPYVVLIGLFFYKAFIYLQTDKQSTKSAISHQSTKKKIETSRPALPDTQLFILAYVAAFTSYLVQNFFGFSVVAINVLYFLLPAFLFITTHTPQSIKRVTFLLPNILQQKIGKAVSLATLVLIGLWLTTDVARLWAADVLYASGYNAALDGRATKAYTAMAEAIAINPNEPLYTSQLGLVASELVEPAREEGEPELATGLKDDAVAFTQSAVRVSPKNTNFLRTAAKVYANLSMSEPQYITFAVAYAQKVVDKSPTDPSDRLRLAKAHQIAGNKQAAESTYEQAIALKTDYYEAREAYASYLLSQAVTNATITDSKLLAKANEQLTVVASSSSGLSANAKATLATLSALPSTNTGGQSR